MTAPAPPAIAHARPAEEGVIREFVRASLRPSTYSPTRNPYLWFGFLWGLPVPLAALFVDCVARGLPLTITTARQALYEHPFQLFFLLHPPLFAALFAILGAIRLDKEAQLRTLVSGLEKSLDATRELNRRLQQIQGLRDERVAMVTHELKNPISTIQGYGEMLLSEDLGHLDPSQRDALMATQRNVSRLARLVNDMLVSSAIEANRLQVELAPFELAPVIDSVVASLAPVATQRTTELRSHVPEQLVVVGDAVRIEHVLTNLTSNALRAVERGGRVDILAEARPEGVARISVVDNGPGIPAENIPYLGQLYYQVVGRRRGGTGLGLHIVKGILEAHHRTLHIDSTLGEGTTMWFNLGLGHQHSERSRPPA